MTKKTKDTDDEFTKTDNFITTGEAARLCGVGIHTIVGWCITELVKFYSIPGSTHRRVSVHSLRSLLRKSKMPTDLLDKEYPA